MSIEISDYADFTTPIIATETGTAETSHPSFGLGETEPLPTLALGAGCLLLVLVARAVIRSKGSWLEDK